VRIQQRELGLPLDGVPTITGGEPFAGGPWNNFVLQATAAMLDRLRSDAGRGALGMVTTVSGFLHKPGLAVYSTDPGPGPLEPADLGEQAAAATAERSDTPYRAIASVGTQGQVQSQTQEQSQIQEQSQNSSACSSAVSCKYKSACGIKIKNRKSTINHRTIRNSSFVIHN
jgi:acetyl-CoA C-acetyltransferase